MNQSLPPELSELEQLLSTLAPRQLSAETTDRLAASCEESATCHDVGLDELEKHLGEINPTTMRTDVLSRMIKAMDSWHEHVPVEEKVVSFSGQNTAPSRPQSKSSGMLAAAAAVAMLGALTALVMPHLSPDEEIAGVANSYPVSSDTSDLSVTGQLDSTQAWFAPDALSHRVVNTADRGIVMAGNQSPHRCIRLDSMETIKIEDEDGREITIDRPRVQYVLIPVQTN